MEVISNLVSKKENRTAAMRATMSMLSTQTDHTSQRGASIITLSNRSKVDSLSHMRIAQWMNES